MNPYSKYSYLIGKTLTYRELCEAIGETPKSGKGQQLHIKRLEKSFMLKKISMGTRNTKYLVEAFKLENTTVIKGTCAPAFTNRMLSILQESSPITETYFSLIIKLRMTKPSYYSIRNNAENLIEETNSTFSEESEEDLNEDEARRDELFRKVSYAVIKEIIRKQIAQMKNKGLIDFSKWFFFKNVNEEWNIASEEEQQDIVNIQNKILAKYNLSRIETLYSRNKDNRKAKIEYEDTLEEYIKSKAYSSYMIGYRITITDAGRSFIIDSSLAESEKLQTYVSQKVRDAKRMKECQSIYNMESQFDKYLYCSPKTA